jgi:hypothetical protein
MIASINCCAIMSLVAIIAGILSLVAAEIILPGVLVATMHDTMSVDTPSKFDKILGTERSQPYVITFLNVSNALALQTESPAPTPIFKEVSVNYSMKSRAFGYELSSDKSVYSYKMWTYMEPVNEAEKHLEIVQINPVLLATLAPLGGELTLKAVHDAAQAAFVAAGMDGSDPQAHFTAGCLSLNPNPDALPACLGGALMYAALKLEASLPLKADGTGMMNAGLFVRHTVDEMMNGYLDPLTQQQYPGSFFGYNVYPTQSAQEAALAAGLDTPDRFVRTMRTGKTNVNDIGKWVSLKTFANVSVTHNNPFWVVPPISYDNTGRTTSGNPFVLTGLRSMAQPMSPLSSPPSLLSAGFPPKAAPTSGQQFSYFDDLYTWRDLTYSCGADGCPRETLHGELSVLKYSLDAASGLLTKDGVDDPVGLCAATFSCDYGSFMPFVWSTPALSYSLPYFGLSSSFLTGAAAFQSADGSALQYEDATMRPEAYIEPFSGSLVKMRSRMQTNLNGVSSQLFNGVLYPNFFSATLPAVWPLLLTTTDFSVSADDAGVIGGGVKFVYLLMMLCYVFSAVMLGWLGFFVHKARASNARVEPPGKEELTESSTSTVRSDPVSA